MSLHHTTLLPCIPTSTDCKWNYLMPSLHWGTSVLAKVPPHRKRHAAVYIIQHIAAYFTRVGSYELTMLRDRLTANGGTSSTHATHSIPRPTAHWVQSTWHETTDSELVCDCIKGWNRAWWHTSNLHGGGEDGCGGTYECKKVHVVDATCALLVHPIMPWSTEWAQWEDLFSV